MTFQNSTFHPLPSPLTGKFGRTLEYYLCSPNLIIAVAHFMILFPFLLYIQYKAVDEGYENKKVISLLQSTIVVRDIVLHSICFYFSERRCQEKLIYYLTTNRNDKSLFTACWCKLSFIAGTFSSETIFLHLVVRLYSYI